MSHEFLIFLPLIICIVMFLLNFPVYTCLLVPGLTYFIFICQDMDVGVCYQRISVAIENYPLMAVPFFVMAGEIMNYAGISKRLMKIARMAVSRFTGGLAHVNILLSCLMGGVSGSSLADCANECKILVPDMVEDGYPLDFCAALTAIASIVTPIIPPGISLIMFAYYANCSVGDMFMAGYLPAIVICLILMFTCWRMSKKNGWGGKDKTHYTAKEWGAALLDAVWALFMPIGLIGGMRIGLFTATEGGAMCVLYASLVGLFVYKEMKISDFKAIVVSSMKSTASILIIVGSAAALGYYLSWEGIPQMVTNMVLGISTNKYVVLLLLNIFLFILGMFMEGNVVTVLVLPLLLPVINQLGINIVHFGIVYSVNGLLGCCTPPFGTVMFTACSTLGVTIKEYAKAAWPLILASVIALLILTYLPIISLLIPGLVNGNLASLPLF